jgi:hypothetical protein
MAGQVTERSAVGLYLAAIVAANVTTAALGPSWSVVVAFLFIGLDLTTRDVLHDAWQGRDLMLRMGALIVVGGAISWVLTPGAGQIAVASTVAFMAAATADGLVYALLGDRAKRLRVNGSNVAGAAVDSVVFPAIAFGFPLLLPIMAGQFIAKVGGGAVWYEVLRAVSQRRRAA